MLTHSATLRISEDEEELLTHETTLLLIETKERRFQLNMNYVPFWSWFRQERANIAHSGGNLLQDNGLGVILRRTHLQRRVRESSDL